MNTELQSSKHSLPECPNCGRNALVQPSRDRYHCLWCGFKRDLSEPEWETSLVLFLLALAIVMAVVMELK